MNESVCKSSWLQVLEDTWSDAKCKKTPAISYYLHSYFEQSENCFLCALHLMSSASDFFKGKPTGLCATIMQEFFIWISDRHHIYDYLLTSELKRHALKQALKQKGTNIIENVCRTFRIDENGKEYLDIVKDLLKHQHYNEASLLVVKLKLHDYFTVEEVVAPLFLLDKISLLENYLENKPELQKQALKYLDSMYGDNNKINSLLYKMKLYSVQREKLKGKTLAKIITRLLKQYNLPPDFCPNVYQFRSRGALKFLVNKKYSEGNIATESWNEMVLETVGDNTTLQRDLVIELVLINDLETALMFAQRFNIPQKQWSPHLQDYFQSRKSGGAPQTFDYNETWRLDGEKQDYQPYLALRLDDEDVILVKTVEQLSMCIETLQCYDVIGMDAEWKPTLGLNSSRLSLIQLAVWDYVFILDILELSEVLQKRHWISFYYEILCAPEILKIGYGVAEDLKFIASVCGCQEIKPAMVLDLCVFVNKMQISCPELVEASTSTTPSEKEHKGLSELTRALLGVPLNKEEQFSDWERRPLRSTQIIYAALDAFCLIQIYELLYGRAIKLGLDLRELMTQTLKSKKKDQKNTSPKKKNKSPQIRNETNRDAPPVAASDFKVVLDTMVTGLGKVLRRAGIDTVTLEDSADHDMTVKIAEKENRVIVTSGTPYERLKQFVPEGMCYCVNVTDSAKEQARAILSHYNVQIQESDIFSRCTVCNGGSYIEMPVEDMKILCTPNAGKELENLLGQYKNGNVDLSTGKLENGMPIICDYVTCTQLASVGLFFICTNCGKVYWEGSHYKRVKDSLQGVISPSTHQANKCTNK